MMCSTGTSCFDIAQWLPWQHDYERSLTPISDWVVMIMARTGRQLAIRTYLVAKRLQAFRPPTWDIHTGCPMSEVWHPKSDVQSPKSKVQSLKSYIWSSKSKVRSQKSQGRCPLSSSFFLFLSVPARKATSLCVAYLSWLSAFDQKKNGISKIVA